MGSGQDRYIFFQLENGTGGKKSVLCIPFPGIRLFTPLCTWAKNMDRVSPCASAPDAWFDTPANILESTS